MTDHIKEATVNLCLDCGTSHAAGPCDPEQKRRYQDAKKRMHGDYVQQLRDNAPKHAERIVELIALMQAKGKYFFNDTLYEVRSLRESMELQYKLS